MSEKHDAKQIEVYTAEGCPHCVELKKLLDKKGIAYEEVDIFNTPDKAKELLDTMKTFALPLTCVTKGKKKRCVAGIDEEQIDKLLGIKR